MARRSTTFNSAIVSALFSISDYRANDVKSTSKTREPVSKICQGKGAEIHANAYKQFPATQSEGCGSMCSPGQARGLGRRCYVVKSLGSPGVEADRVSYLCC